MTLATSFSGISSGVDTDSLVKAIISQEGRSLNRLNALQTKNKAKATAVTAIKNGINSVATSLAVLQDKLNTGDSAAITSAMQDVVTKINAVQKLYKEGSAVTKGSDGSIVQGPLYGDPTLKEMMAQMKSAFSGSKTTTVSSYSNPASIGVKTGVDGSLGVDSATLQAALSSDPNAVKSIGGFTDLRALVTQYTASSPNAPILAIQQRIEVQNKALSSQIASAQTSLTRREAALKAQFSKMETVIAQLKAASGSLNSVF